MSHIPINNIGLDKESIFEISSYGYKPLKKGTNERENDDLFGMPKRPRTTPDIPEGKNIDDHLQNWYKADYDESNQDLLSLATAKTEVNVQIVKSVTKQKQIFTKPIGRHCIESWKGYDQTRKADKIRRNVGNLADYVRFVVCEKLMANDDVAVRFCQIIETCTHLVLRTLASHYAKGLKFDFFIDKCFVAIQEDIRARTGIIIPEPTFDNYPGQGLSNKFLAQEAKKLSIATNCVYSVSCRAINHMLWIYGSFFLNRILSFAKAAGRDFFIVGDVDRALMP